MTYVEFFFIILFSVAIHEWGHYIASRMYNISVTHFSIGFGPALFKFKWKETLFAFRLLPLGGFVANDEESYERLKLHQKIVILLAGLAMNFLVIIGALLVKSQGNIKAVFLLMLEMPRIMYENMMKISFAEIYSPKGDVGNSIVEIGQLGTDLNFWVLLASVNVVFILLNILPLPALDGGRVLLTLAQHAAIGLGAPKERVKTISDVLIVASFLLLLSPIFINNLWSAGQDIGLNLFESILWFALIITVIINIRLFIENRKSTTQ